jgi:hypothetical protein
MQVLRAFISWAVDPSPEVGGAPPERSTLFITQALE